MSKTMDGRATVYMGEPQDVDVYHADRWVPGSLLGWRHDDGGSCLLMVRLTAGSMEETAWADLTNVRLPERSPVGVPGAGWGDVGSDRSASLALDLSHTEPRPTGRELDRWLVGRTGPVEDAQHRC